MGIIKLTLIGSGRFIVPIATMGVGAGEGFRLLVQARANGRTFQDTVLGGPAVGVAGVGAGFLLSRSVVGIVEANALAGFPVFSFAIDFNVGVRFYL